MRALVALTIYLSLGGSSGYSAESTWHGLHDRGVAAAGQRDFRAAYVLLHESWELAQTPLQHAVSANDLGVTLHQMNRDGEAVAWLVRALAVWERDPSHHVHAVQTSQALAAALRAQGEYSMGAQLLRRTLAAYSVDGEEKALILNMLADSMREEGKTDRARKVFGDVLRMPDISWKRLFEADTGLADLDSTARLWENSAAEWNTAGNIAREHHDDVREAVVWRGLGEMWLEQENRTRAEPLLRRALAVFENDPFSGDQIGPTLSCLGELYLGEGKPAQAEEVLTRALAIEEGIASKNPRTALLLELLADAAALRNQMDVARDYFGRAQRIVEQRLGQDSPICGAVFANWGVAEQRSGDNRRAAAQYEKALAVLRTGGRDVTALRLRVTQRYAAVLKSMHHRKEANALLAEVKSFREK
jgi:tetratricopeptide (TPR) repeat protein